MATTSPDSGTSWKPLTSEEKKNIKGAMYVAKPVYTTPAAPSAPAASSGGGDNGYSAYASLLNQMLAQQKAQQAELERQRAAQQAALAKQRDETLAAWKTAADDYKNNQGILRDEQNNLINTNFGTSSGQLTDAKNAANKDSYVAYMKGLKAMPQVSAMSGNGGYAQSLLAKQQLGYENNRNTIEQNYLDQLKALTAERDAALLQNSQTYNNNMTNFDLDYQNRVAGLKQNYVNSAYTVDSDYMDKIIANQQAYTGAMTGDVDYMSELKNLVKTNTPTAGSATGGSTFTGKYKVGNKTMSRSEYMDYLISYGMTAEEAVDYMEKNGIPF